MGERLPWLLKGRTLGLIGVGTIGSEIAKRAESFGMRVIALRRRPAYGTIGHVERVYGKDQLDEFLGAEPRARDLRAADAGNAFADGRARSSRSCREARSSSTSAAPRSSTPTR